MAHITLLPELGEILVRLYWLGEVLASTPIATYTVIYFIQIGQLFRKICTDKLFRTQTDRQTHRQTHRHTDRQIDR